MSGIINGRFVKDAKPSGLKTTNQYKSYRHSMQRLDNKREILQPYKGNKPNPEFIRQYPEQAEKYFGNEGVRKYGNE